MQVRDAMSKPVLVVGPDHTLRQVAQLMSARRVGSAIVVDPTPRASGSSPNGTCCTRWGRGSTRTRSSSATT